MATTIRRDAYHQLREAIVAGRLQPSERLVETTLAKLLGSGRTSIRAALVRLDQEGLVVLEPNRGARVRVIDDREALEIEEVRGALEAFLARRAAARMTPALLGELERMLEEMRARVREGDALGYSELNAPFHQLIWAAAAHSTSTRIVGSLKTQAIRFRYQTALRPGRTERSLQEHERIVQALRSGDGEAAEKAMRDHLAEVLDTLRWAIERQPQPTGWHTSG